MVDGFEAFSASEENRNNISCKRFCHPVDDKNQFLPKQRCNYLKRSVPLRKPMTTILRH